MTSVEVAVVRSMVDVSEAFARIAATLRGVDSVRQVSCPCWLRSEERVGNEHFRVGGKGGFRVEWYAEAQFNDGRGLSFSQEAAWHDEEWIIDASVREYIEGEEEVLTELPRRHAVSADEVIRELQGQACLLEKIHEQLIRNFLSRG